MPSYSITPEVQVFPCPNCRETINTTMSACKYCGTTLDHAAAKQAAAETSRISAACSDASYLKVMAGALLASIIIMFVPMLGLVGIAGLWFLRFAIPFMCVRWWVKYGKIKTTDPDFSSARTTAIWTSVFAVAGLLWISYTILPQIHVGI